MRSGDLIRVDFGIPIGSTPALVRPAVVVTADPTLSVFTTTFHVVPLTSNTERAWATDVPVAMNDGTTSAAQCHLLTVVDHGQVVGAASDNVGAVVLAQIRSVIADLLDLPL